MLLYHGFPRGALERLGAPRAQNLGLAQLEMTVEHGLVLTPEWFCIPENPLAARREGESPTTEFLQIRACFTLAQRSELWATNHGAKSHMNHFGNFAIGLRPSHARRMGAVPVLYTYDTFDGMASGSGEVNLTREMLFNLRELRSLAIAVARIEARAANPERNSLDAAMLDALGYDLKGDPAISRAIEQLSLVEAREVIRYLDTDRDAAWSLVDKIDIMLNMFQTADSRRAPLQGPQGQHAYYEQREWRIVRLYSPVVLCQTLGPDYELDGVAAMSENERRTIRDRLMAMNGLIFDDWRLDNSAVLRGTAGQSGDRSFFSFVEEVICPSDVATQVHGVIGVNEFSGTPVVAGKTSSGPELTVFVRKVCM